MLNRGLRNSRIGLRPGWRSQGSGWKQCHKENKRDQWRQEKGPHRHKWGDKEKGHKVRVRRPVWKGRANPCLSWKRQWSHMLTCESLQCINTQCMKWWKQEETPLDKSHLGKEAHSLVSVHRIPPHKCNGSTYRKLETRLSPERTRRQDGGEICFYRIFLSPPPNRQVLPFLLEEERERGKKYLSNYWIKRENKNWK